MGGTSQYCTLLASRLTHATVLARQAWNIARRRARCACHETRRALDAAPLYAIRVPRALEAPRSGSKRGV